MSRGFNGQQILLGADLSHHNYGEINPALFDFVWLKATEGRTYIDSKMNTFLTEMAEQCGGDGVPFIGFYHYARAENNLPEEEAEHFIKTIEPHIGNCLMALDWEGKSADINQSWAVRWLNHVKAKTGHTPLIYCSASVTKKLGTVATAGYPLWVAHYISAKRKSLQPDFYNWADYKFWQFTNAPFDVDIFKGSRADLVTLINS